MQNEYIDILDEGCYATGHEIASCLYKYTAEKETYWWIIACYKCSSFLLHSLFGSCLIYIS